MGGIGLLTSFTVLKHSSSTLKLKNHRYFSFLRRKPFSAERLTTMNVKTNENSFTVVQFGINAQQESAIRLTNT
jgi:hypothetical protein